MVSPSTTNPRLAFSAPKSPIPPPPGAIKRRFSETDLDAESDACVEGAKRNCRDPDCTDSDLMDIDVDDDVRPVCSDVPEREETLPPENGDEQKEVNKDDEVLDDAMQGMQDGLFDEVLKEMEEMLEIEFDPQPAKPKAKVRKTVSWAENLAVVVGVAAGGGGQDSDYDTEDDDSEDYDSEDDDSEDYDSEDYDSEDYDSDEE